MPSLMTRTVPATVIGFPSSTDKEWPRASVRVAPTRTCAAMESTVTFVVLSRLAATLASKQAELDQQQCQFAVLDTQELQLRAEAKAKQAALDLAMLMIVLAVRKRCCPTFSSSNDCCAEMSDG